MEVSTIFSTGAIIKMATEFTKIIMEMNIMASSN